MAYIEERPCGCESTGVGIHGDACGRCEGTGIVEVYVTEPGDCRLCDGTGRVALGRRCPKGCEPPEEERPSWADDFWRL